MTSRKFWEFSDPPPPSVTLKWLFYLQLYTYTKQSMPATPLEMMPDWSIELVLANLLNFELMPISLSSNFKSTNGVMKSAENWTTTASTGFGRVDCQPAGKVQLVDINIGKNMKIIIFKFSKMQKISKFWLFELFFNFFQLLVDGFCMYFLMKRE